MTKKESARKFFQAKKLKSAKNELYFISPLVLTFFFTKNGLL